MPRTKVREIATVARERGLPLHMDGARFANAVAWLGCPPAEITWRAGVDVLSFGATKNGALTAEALVIFGHPEWLEGMERRRKRGGHLLSKMRYVSAQLLAMLDDDLWLQLAGQANARAAQLAQAIEASPLPALEWPVEANEVFMRAAPQKLASIWPGSKTSRLRRFWKASNSTSGQATMTSPAWSVHSPPPKNRCQNWQPP
jgi:threonine aldolase